MSYLRPVLSAANLLAFLEGTSLGLVDVGEEVRLQAPQIVEKVTKTESRKWRAHRRPSPGRSRCMRGVGIAVVLFFALSLSLQGVTCDRAGCGPIRQGNSVVCFTPARPVSLSGELKAVDPNPLPRERDTTNFNEVREPYWGRHWFYGVDIENGWILAGLAHGIGIWDARGNPANPTFVASRIYGPGGQAFPEIPAGESSKIVFGGIDAPDDSVAALAGYGAGTLVFDLRIKQQPIPVYQHAVTAESVYATRLKGARYAYVASWAPPGVYIYDLDRALQANGCLDLAVEPEDSVCHGVLAGRIDTPAPSYYVHGVGNYLVVSFGASRGFQVYDLTSPAHPTIKLTGLRGSTGRAVQGVALWNEGSLYYLGARLSASLIEGEQTAIYDVSCITNTDGCPELGPPLAMMETPSRGGSNYLTFSRANGVTPFLYAGTDASCGGEDGKQREWLFDLSNPERPRDVTPLVTVPVVGIYKGVPQTKRINYWSYYYRGSPTGFNLVAPRAGKFYGNYFYRAARSMFDIHLWAAAAKPVASLEYSPAIPSPGQMVEFRSTASGSPTSYTWSFTSGIPSYRNGASASTQWSRPGIKKVYHSVCNKLGCDSISTEIGIATFADVPPSHWAWPSIEALAVARATSGCGAVPPRFCPESQITRAELAVLLVRTRRGASYIPPAAKGVFADVSASSWAAPYIEQLYRDGITAGCGSGVFCPDKAVTRAEIAVWLVKMRRGGSYVPPRATGVFVDVTSTYWAAPFIEQLYRDRITEGCGASPRRFCPDSTLTRAEAAVLLQRTFLAPIR